LTSHTLSEVFPKFVFKIYFVIWAPVLGPTLPNPAENLCRLVEQDFFMGPSVLKPRREQRALAVTIHNWTLMKGDCYFNAGFPTPHHIIAA